MSRRSSRLLVCVRFIFVPMCVAIPCMALAVAPQIEIDGRLHAGESVIEQAVAPETVLTRGDELRLRVMAADAGYLYVIALGSSGSALALAPFGGAAPVAVSAGEVVAVPADGGYLPLDGRPGTETFLAFVTPAPLTSIARILVRLEARGNGEAGARQVMADLGYDAGSFSVRHVAAEVALASRQAAKVPPAARTRSGEAPAVLSGLGSRIAGFTAGGEERPAVASSGANASGVDTRSRDDVPASNRQNDDSLRVDDEPAPSGGFLAGVASLLGFGGDDDPKPPTPPAEPVQPAATFALGTRAGRSPVVVATGEGGSPATPESIAAAASGEAPVTSSDASPGVSPVAPAGAPAVAPPGAPPGDPAGATASAAPERQPESPQPLATRRVPPEVPEPPAPRAASATDDSNLPPVESREGAPVREAGLFSALGALLVADPEHPAEPAPVVASRSTDEAPPAKNADRARSQAELPAPDRPSATDIASAASSSEDAPTVRETEPGYRVAGAIGEASAMPREPPVASPEPVRDGDTTAARVDTGEEPTLTRALDESGRKVVRLQGGAPPSAASQGEGVVLSRSGSRIRALLGEAAPAAQSAEPTTAPGGGSVLAATPGPAVMSPVPVPVASARTPGSPPDETATPRLAMQRDLLDHQGPAGSVVMVVTPRSAGSGIIVDTHGRVLTSWHAVEGQEFATVVFTRSGVAADIRRRARILAHSKFSDLALLQVEGTPAGYRPVVFATGAGLADDTPLHVVGPDSGGTWRHDVLHDTRERPSSSWYSASRVLHRANVIRARIGEAAPALGGALYNERLELVGLATLVRAGKGELIGISAATLRAFLDKAG